MKHKPKILCFDIESAGVNALKSDLGFVILFGYKWLHQKKAHTIKIERQYLKRFDDSKLLKKASKVFQKADLIVAHFGSVFDRRFIQGRLLINDLPPIPNTKMRDTCMMARSIANYSSNRLKHLAKILNLKNQKLENNWPSAWFQVMRGNIKCLNDLAKYCEGDVLALEELYLRLRPYDNPHPRLTESRSLCRVCGGKVQYHGFAYIGENKYRRYQCIDCNKWDRERKAVK